MGSCRGQRGSERLEDVVLGHLAGGKLLCGRIQQHGHGARLCGLHSRNESLVVWSLEGPGSAVSKPRFF